LEALSAGEAVAKRILRFELGALRVLGHLPTLEICAGCGEPVPAAGRMAFAHLDGGVLCARCRPGKAQVASISAAALRTMVQLADPQRQTWRRIDIAPRIGGEIRGILNHYLHHLLGHKTRMHPYLALLSN